MEIEQTFSDAVLLETLQVTAVESTQRGLLVCQVLNQVEFAPHVVLEGHVVLRIHSVHFSFRLRVAKQWT